MQTSQPVKFLPFLNINLGHNPGAAFGLLASSDGWQRWLFIGVAVFISVVILVWSTRLRKKDWLEAMAIGMILGGAWGNMLDRLLQGTVTDFIDFYIGNWHWYMFNIADVGICAGAFLLILGAAFKPKLLQQS